MAGGEKGGDFGSYVALFRRRRVWIITIVPAALLTAAFLAFALPALYQSTATIILEQGSIPEDFIKSTVNSLGDEQIEVLEGRVMTLAALRDLVMKFDPYPDEKALDVDAKALRIVRDTSFVRVDPVTFLPLVHSPAVSLSYQNPDPQRASIVARELTDLFLTYHQRVRLDSARMAAKLVQDRADELTKELQALDGEFARLRIAHGGILPEVDARGEDARYRAERDLTDTERQLRDAQQQESLYTLQLAGTSPNLMTDKGDLTDMATVKAQLADALQRYTPQHPDVKRLQRALAALQAQSGKNGSTPAADADNPEYRKIATQLAAARADVAALQAATARAREQLAQYTASVNPSAEEERQIGDLERRRASLQTEFQEVQEKLKSAQLGQQVESDEHAEHFVMIQAPFAASQPHSPNRLGIILLGLVLGMAITAAAVAIAESTDQTVRGLIDVEALVTLPVLGNLPVIRRPDERIRIRLIWGGISALYVVGAVMVVIAFSQAHSRVERAEQGVAHAAATGS